jgi:hypothetical protein
MLTAQMTGAPEPMTQQFGLRTIVLYDSHV